MREIKFRAWRIPSKEWWDHEGVLSLLMLHGRVLDRTADDKGYLNNFAIEQYTGLKDRNGVEIYEGDVVLVPYNYIGSVEVRWAGGGKYNIASYNIIKLKVIGNIHENPELLED